MGRGGGGILLYVLVLVAVLMLVLRVDDHVEVANGEEILPLPLLTNFASISLPHHSRNYFFCNGILFN